MKKPSAAEAVRGFQLGYSLGRNRVTNTLTGSRERGPRHLLRGHFTPTLFQGSLGNRGRCLFCFRRLLAFFVRRTVTHLRGFRMSIRIGCVGVILVWAGITALAVNGDGVDQ